MSAADFQFQYCGDCLGELVPNGTTLTADPNADFDVMDVVAVVLNPDVAGPFTAFMNGIGGSGYAGVTKLYLGEHKSANGETVYRLAQLNPPLITPIPESVIVSISKVVDGDVDMAGGGLSPADKEAFELLFPFAIGRETIQ